MKAVVIAMLLMTAGFVAVVAAPTASACSVNVNDLAGDLSDCGNTAIDSVQCIVFHHCT